MEPALEDIRAQEKATNSSSSPLPSSSSSPAHEFSFTISLHSSTTTKPSSPSSKTKQPLAIHDLSPADDIFFHGHLLPLHFLSHLHSSPRPSTHSLDNFTLPVPDYLPPLKNNTAQERVNINCNNKPRSSFSLLGLKNWKKGLSEKAEKSKSKSKSEEINNNKMRKVKFDLSQFLKRYIKMVKPLLSGGRREIHRGRRQSYSFSETVSRRDYCEDFNGRRGEFSAPASMRTSAINSGRLLGSGEVVSAVSDSTMEDLQAAIQAAIAHCKDSSISVHDNHNHTNTNKLQSQELCSIAVN